MSDKNYIDSVKTGCKRRGKKELLQHLEGKKITRNQAIKAKCYDCNGMGESKECDIETCSLYPYSQFKAKIDK